MSLTLYYAPGACSFVPHVLLQMAGADFEPSLVKLHKGEQRSEAYLALNPAGQVPVLVDGGQALTQILAIVMHLDALFPQAGVLPAGGMARSQAISRLAWMNNTVHPTFTHVFMPQKFSDDPDVQGKLKRYNSGLYLGLLEELESMAATASPWLSGIQPGALDAYALTLLRWGGYAGIDPLGLPQLWALVQRLAVLPAVAQVIERERLQLNVFQPPTA